MNLKRLIPSSKVLGLCAVGFFAFGTLWGFYGAPLRLSGNGTTLTLVCKEDWLSKETVQRVERRLGVKIEKTSFNSWAEYLGLLANSQGHFDLVCTHSFLAKDLLSSQWIDKFDYKSLEAYRGIAPEFRSLPFDPEQSFYVPIGWLINGFATEKDSRLNLSWKSLWPGQGKKLSLSYPDLELYVRMRMDDFEIDPEKQGRYNREPESEAARFLRTLGSVHSPTRKLDSEMLKIHEVLQVTNSQLSRMENKSKLNYTALADGTNIWFLLVGVGSQSAHKELAREVVEELLSPRTSEELRILNGFAHILSHFNDAPQVPTEMKATFMREFPLRSIRFPDLDLEGLPQWETMTNKLLEGSAPSKQD